MFAHFSATVLPVHDTLAQECHFYLYLYSYLENVFAVKRIFPVFFFVNLQLLWLSFILWTSLVSTYIFALFLQQLSKYTDPGHPDSFHIENALETMKQMINILNDSIQSSCKLASNSHMRRTFRRK